MAKQKYGIDDILTAVAWGEARAWRTLRLRARTPAAPVPNDTPVQDERARRRAKLEASIDVLSEYRTDLTQRWQGAATNALELDRTGPIGDGWASHAAALANEHTILNNQITALRRELQGVPPVLSARQEAHP